MAVGASNSGTVVEIYRLNEATATLDAVGAVNAKTLTANGNPTVVTGWIDGARRTGSAMWFERADAAVNFAPASLTVQWCGRLRALPASEVAIIHRGDGVLAGGGNYGWLISVDTLGSLRLRVRGRLSGVDTTTTVVLVSQLPLDHRIHLAFTSSGGQDASSTGGTLIAYVDGAAVHTSTGVARGLTPSSNRFMLGRFNAASSVDADHEDVGVYGAIRTATQIRIDALNALGRGTAATTGSGTIATAVTALGHQSTYTEHTISTHGAQRPWAPVSTAKISNGRAPPSQVLSQLAGGLGHMRGRHPKILLSRGFLPASTGVAGPLTIAYLRWTTSPTASYARVRAWAQSSNTMSSSLRPQMYFNADTATAVKSDGRHRTLTIPGVIEGRIAVEPGKTTTLTVQVKDELRVTSLLVMEEPRDDLDGSAFFVSPESCVRGRPITTDVLGGLYRWEHDLYREQRPPLLVWSLDEAATGLAHTTAVGAYVNVLGGETQSAWSWQSSAGGTARGWVVYPFRRAYASSSIVYASVSCHFATAVAADTTVRFASPIGVVDIAVLAGQSGWFDGATSLQLRGGIEEELVQVLMTTGGGLSTLTGLALMPATA